MGSSDKVGGHYGKIHLVRLSDAWYLARHEVTRGQFARFVQQSGYQTEAERNGKGSHGYDPRTNKLTGPERRFNWRFTGFPYGDAHPVVSVAWNDAVAFCEWLTDSERQAGRLAPNERYDLPTEAQWEYACRAGTTTAYYHGDEHDSLSQVANVADRSFQTQFSRSEAFHKNVQGAIKSVDGYAFTAPVGRFRANAFGLHDMHGNVWEWCRDWFGPYDLTWSDDPIGPSTGKARAMRGGGWDWGWLDCSSEYRSSNAPAVRYPTLGFRAALILGGLTDKEAQVLPGVVGPKRSEQLSSPSRLRVPFGANEAARAQHDWAKQLGRQVEETNTLGMKLVLIPPGEFERGMGEERDRPTHQIRITRPFYLGKYEVTRGQFARFARESGYKTESERDGKGARGYDSKINDLTGRSPRFSWRFTGFPYGDSHPVVGLTWNDATTFCNWLTQSERDAGRMDQDERYDLPTDAQWEYACRAGTMTRYHCGDDPEELAKVANVADAEFKERFLPSKNWKARLQTAITSSDGFIFTAPVGRFRANAFGLHDMHGNAWEWCRDWDGSNDLETLDDPEGPLEGSKRLVRGGGYDWGWDACASAFSVSQPPSFHEVPLGFRVVRVSVKRED
jgi:formylglycine-generating enzyme required for sulfatase activity